MQRDRLDALLDRHDRASSNALNLVAGAIVPWNTTYLEAAMRHPDQ